MKLKLDDKNYMEIAVDIEGKLNISIKARKNNNTIVLVTAKLNEEELDTLIKTLVFMKPKMK